MRHALVKLLLMAAMLLGITACQEKPFDPSKPRVMDVVQG